MTDATDRDADALVARALAATGIAADRFTAIAADLLLPPRLRLGEGLRTTVAGLLDGLVATIERELRGPAGDLDALRLPSAAEALLAGESLLAGPIIARARALSDPALIAIALRRAEAHAARLPATPALRGDAVASDPLDALARSAEVAVAAAAKALLVGESSRLGRFQEPLLLRDDLPAELAWQVTWVVAAALRRALADAGFAPASTDRRIAAAAARSLARHDEGGSVDACAMRLALALQADHRMTDDLLVAALDHGRMTLFVAALAVRAGIDHAAAWDIALDPARAALTVLLRAIDMPRASAAAMLLRLDPATAADDIVLRLAAFDALDAERARDVLRARRLDPGYRSAIAALAAGLSRAGAS